MTRTPLILALAAAAALAGCNKEDHTIVAGGPQEEPENKVAEANVTLPPSIAASKTYRCKDNSLVQIDWLSNDKGAYVHGNGQAQTHLKPAEPVEGKPASSDLTAEGGYLLKGNATASTVNLTLPGKGAQVCKG